jgi:hypothetical protein
VSAEHHEEVTVVLLDAVPRQKQRREQHDPGDAEKRGGWTLPPEHGMSLATVT